METAQEPTEKMGKFALIAVAALVVIVVGIGLTLMLWNAPAPSARVEHVIPDAKLPK
jgi:flagellar basal body-associated protein FliL